MANSKKLSQWLHNPYTGEEIEITATTENALNNKCEKQIKAWEKEQAEWEWQQHVEEQKQYVQQMDEENWQLIQNLRRHMLSYIVRWSSYRYYDGLKRKRRYSDIFSPPTIKEINKELKVPIEYQLLDTIIVNGYRVFLDRSQPGDIWEFKKTVDSERFYVKLKIQNRNGKDILKCLSFHEDDYS